MLYYLLYPLRDIFFGFNVFRYITFRATMAAVTTFLFCIIVGPLIIKQLQRFKISENIRLRACPPLQELHKPKEGTPTMGGIIILLGIIVLFIGATLEGILSFMLAFLLLSRVLLIISGALFYIGLIPPEFVRKRILKEK